MQYFVQKSDVPTKRLQFQSYFPAEPIFAEHNHNSTIRVSGFFSFFSNPLAYTISSAEIVTQHQPNHFFQKNGHLDTLGGAKGFCGGQIPVFLTIQKVQLLEQ